MYALTVTTRSQLERAISRSQVQKPRIREIEFGIYSVQSTDPKKPDTYYDTGIQSAQDGGYEVMCTCPTEPRIDRKTGEKKDRFCKHVAAVLPHYQMREREEADKLRAAGLLCTNCGNPANVFSLAGGERLCWDCVMVKADAEADKDAAQTMLAETEAEESFNRDHEDLFGFAPVRRERVKEAW